MNYFRLRKYFVYIFVLLLVVIFLFFNGNNRNKLSKTVNKEEFVNISNVSNEFFYNYLDEVRNIDSKDKENILIVTSLSKVKNTYGAFNVIEAPNNQYFLQYDSENKKDKALKELKKNSNIIVEENIYFTLENEGSSGSYNTWGAEKLGFDDVIESVDYNRLNKVVVAIIDSGLELDEFNKYYNGKVEETYNFHYPDTEVTTDSSGHGTHIAGTIAELTPFNVKILPVKVTGSDGKIILSDVITVINDIVKNHKSDVISMSFGGYNLTGITALESVINGAINENIICVASAGNSNIDDIHYPSGYDNVISVTAVDSNLDKTWFSTYGKTVTFGAPGYRIESINTDQTKRIKNGTSMAVPHVSSAVSILKSFNKDLTFNDMVNLLKKHAIDIGDDGWDQYYGYGVINFNGVKFCNKDVICDEFNVFEENEIDTLSTIKIEAPSVFNPKYNYGNITNLMDATINLYYTNDDYYTKNLAQLIKDIEIVGYDPNLNEEQDVVIKYNDLETILKVNNINLQNGWEYSVLSDGTISLDTFNHDSSNDSLDKTYESYSYPRVVYIPKEIDGKKISTLGYGLLYGRAVLKRVVIPDGVKSINNNVFGKTATDNEPGPINIIIPNSVSYISDNTFYNTKNVNLLVDRDSYAYDYAISKNLDYLYINDVDINLSNKKFNAFEKVGSDKLEVTVSYDGSEKLDENINIYEIKYMNSSDSFRYGDDKFNISFYTYFGHYIEENIEVEVSKLKPKYDIPSGLVGINGKKLSTIELPDGFEWEDENEIISKKGEQIFYARYVPSDTNNYEIVEKIEIPVLVETTVIVPDITIKDKVYNGLTNISLSDIIIKNLDATDYDIISYSFNEVNVGKTDVKVVLRLTDEKFEYYSFEDGLQEMEYIVLMNIIPEVVEKPLLEVSDYIYNGEEQTVKLKNFDSNKMNIIGNSRKNVGEQDVVISLKNKNYIWNDSTYDDVIFKFKINKADIDINYTSSSSVIKYDGKLHGIEFNIDKSDIVRVKYMDLNGEYTLDDMPMYKDTGEYIIKFKIYIDGNYNDIFGEETLKIISNVIVNNTKDFETYYDGLEHAIDVDINIEDYDIKYSIDNTDYNLDELPKFSNIGEYTVNYKIIANGYDELIGSNKVIIYGIKINTETLILKDNDILLIKNNSLDNLKNKINIFAKEFKYSCFDKDKKVLDSSIIKTGDRVNILLNNSKNYSYYISLLGDINSDSKISSADYVKVRKHIMKSEVIKDTVYFYAADVNVDNKISSADYVKIKKYIMNGESL